MTTTEQLPEIISRYLAAHERHDVDTTVASFTADATVTDEGRTHRGSAEIREWIANAAGEFTFTSELTGVRRIGEDRWIATHHLEGDFPGGVVDLDFDFVVREGKVASLTIAP